MIELTKSVKDGVAVIHCTGRLNMTDAPRLKQRVDAIVAEGLPRIVVDLTGVPFVDSSGLGALISGLKTARQAGGDLRIAGAGEQILAVLGLTNLDRILRPHATIEDARGEW